MSEFQSELLLDDLSQTDDSLLSQALLDLNAAFAHTPLAPNLSDTDSIFDFDQKHETADSMLPDPTMDSLFDSIVSSSESPEVWSVGNVDAIVPTSASWNSFLNGLKSPTAYEIILQCFFNFMRGSRRIYWPLLETECNNLVFVTKTF